MELFKTFLHSEFCRRILSIALGATLLGGVSGNSQDLAYLPLVSALEKPAYVPLIPFGTDYRPGGIVVSCAGTPKYHSCPN